MNLLGVSYLLLWVVALVQMAAIFFLAREVTAIRARAQSGADSPLAPKAPVSEFAAYDLHGDKIVSSTSLVGVPRVLLFLSTDCSVCAQIGHELESSAPESLQQLVLFCHGAQRGCRSSMAGMIGRALVLWDQDSKFADSLHLAGMPALIIVDVKWRIAGVRYPASAADVHDALREVRDPQASAATGALELSTVS